jgi:hypothetical protein
LRPDALYEFVVASDGGTREDIAFRVTFTEPDGAGNQQMRVLRADGAAARQGIEGTLLGEGHTGEIFPLAPGSPFRKDARSESSRIEVKLTVYPSKGPARSSAGP